MVIKRNLVVTLIIGIVISLCVVYLLQTNEPGEELQKTNTQIGSIHAELDVLPIDETIAQSDLVVKVKILEKVKEMNEPSEKTIFKAEVLNRLIDNVKVNSDIIHVMQAGNTQWKFNDNKLFEPGEVYVLFLKKSVTSDIENTFWIRGEEANIYQELDSGDLLKWWKSEPVLEQFENKTLTKTSEKELGNSDSQVVNQDQFINYIVNIDNNAK